MDGFVALPGGLGTLEEIFEVLTWAQLGMHAKPCGLLNVGGYFDSLLEFLDRALAERFVRAAHRDMIVVEGDPAALLDRVTGDDGFTYLLRHEVASGEWRLAGSLLDAPDQRE